MSGDVLGRRALNRALLARQLLLDRSTLSAAGAIEHLVGMQAQIPHAPYVGLWTRLKDFRPEELSRLITSRRAVRGPLLRGTLHLATSRDFLALHPLIKPVLERCLNGSSFARHLAGLDMKRIAAAGRALLDEQPRTGVELSRLLHKRWPDRDERSLGYAVQYLSPLVQLPPRGVWGSTGQVTWATAGSWLGRGPSDKPSAGKMVLRYLAAFGPATVMDMRAWSGVPSLRDVTERLRRRLRTFRTETGIELFDLPDAPRPDPASPAPPRFLPYYDNAALGHADRSRIIPEDPRMRWFRGEGPLVGTVLVDGFVNARWKIVRERDRATLVVEHFIRLTRPDRAALVDEGMRLVRFGAADAGSHDLRVVPAG